MWPFNFRAENNPNLVDMPLKLIMQSNILKQIKIIYLDNISCFLKCFATVETILRDTDPILFVF